MLTRQFSSRIRSDLVEVEKVATQIQKSLLAPLQRVPASHLSDGPLFSITLSSSLLSRPLPIGTFIGSFDAPGSAQFSSARLPNALWTSVRSAALYSGPHDPSVSPH